MPDNDQNGATDAQNAEKGTDPGLGAEANGMDAAKAENGAGAGPTGDANGTAAENTDKGTDPGPGATGDAPNGAHPKADGAGDRPAWTDFNQPIDHETFLVNRPSPLGNTIKKLFGRSRHYLIWLDENNALNFHFNDPLPPHIRPALNEYRRLKSIAPIILKNRDAAKETAEKDAAQQLLAAGLNHAFSACAGEDALVGLKQARSFIETRGEERARTNFLALTTLTSLCVFAVLYLIHYYWTGLLPTLMVRTVIFGGMGGLVGASISLIQRSDTIVVDPLTSPWHKAFHGFLRAVLGMTFGMIVVLAARGDLAFVFAKANGPALFTLAVVGGFSERLVPNLISRLAQDSEESKAKG